MVMQLPCVVNASALSPPVDTVQIENRKMTGCRWAASNTAIRTFSHASPMATKCPNCPNQGRNSNAFLSTSEPERGFGSRIDHHYLKNQPFSVGFFRPLPPVLARVRALLRRTQPPWMTPFQAVFRSLFQPILCFCEGRLRARTSNDAGFRLHVRLGNRLHAGDPPPEQATSSRRAEHPR